MALCCRRCHSEIHRYSKGDGLQASLALSITGLVLCFLANMYPIMTFDVMGNTQSNLIITGIKGLRLQDFTSIALLVFFSAILAPTLHFLGTAYLCVACLFRISLPALSKVARITELMQDWNLMPIFFVACVISALRLDMLGLVNWNLGAFFIVALALCSISLVHFQRPNVVTRILEELK